MASSWRWYRNSHFKPTMNASLIPSQLKQSERVLRMIKMSKPKLPRHNWKAAKFENSYISCFAAIIVNQEAMEHLMTCWPLNLDALSLTHIKRIIDP